MTDELDTHSDNEPVWGTAELELLYHAVFDELQVSNAVLDYGLTDEALTELASAVVTRIDYAFELRWSPDWVGPGEPHTWEDEAGWHALCNSCLTEGPIAVTKEAVVEWHKSHRAETRHGESQQDSTSI